MPNIKSAKKRMELSRKARDRNRPQRTRLRNAIRKVRLAEDGTTAEEGLREAIVLIDRAATERLIHPNKAARLKSRLTRHVQGLGA
jgi:small subunit ribosomal protein S20